MYGVFGVLFAFILLALGLIQMFTYRATPEAQKTWNIAAFEQKNNWTHFESVHYFLSVKFTGIG